MIINKKRKNIISNIKNVLIITILTSLILELISTKFYKNIPKNNIKKLIIDINTLDRSSSRIQYELSEIEANHITQDSIQALFLLYGSNQINEKSLIENMEKGIKRAEIVLSRSQSQCYMCRDFIKEGMILGKEHILNNFKQITKDIKDKILKAKKNKELNELRAELLDSGINWFSQKHKCIDIKNK